MNADCSGLAVDVGHFPGTSELFSYFDHRVQCSRLYAIFLLGALSGILLGCSHFGEQGRYSFGALL